MARTSNTPDSTDSTAGEAPADGIEPTTAPEPAATQEARPSGRKRVIAPKPRVEGEHVVYGATKYPLADAVELGLVPAPPRA